MAENTVDPAAQARDRCPCRLKISSELAHGTLRLRRTSRTPDGTVLDQHQYPLRRASSVVAAGGERLVHRTRGAFDQSAERAFVLYGPQNAVQILPDLPQAPLCPRGDLSTEVTAPCSGETRGHEGQITPQSARRPACRQREYQQRQQAGHPGDGGESSKGRSHRTARHHCEGHTQRLILRVAQRHRKHPPQVLAQLQIAPESVHEHELYWAELSQFVG